MKIKIKSKLNSKNTKEVEKDNNKINNDIILCKIHNQELELFCYTCDEIICKTCQIYGQHNNQMHKINNLNIIIQKKYSDLSNILSKDLMFKKDLFIAQLSQNKNILRNFENFKNSIVQKTSFKYDGILERLRKEEAKNLSILQNEIGILIDEKRQIEEIESIFQLKEKINKIDFLLRIRGYEEKIEYLISKPFNTEIKPNLANLPRELTYLRNKINNENYLVNEIEFKNRIIHKLLINGQQISDNKFKGINYNAKKEIEEWAKLTDKFSNQVKKFQKICFFCSEVLTKNSINNECNVNTSKIKIDNNFQGFTENIPKKKYFGNKYHYFDNPKEDLFKSGEAFKNLQNLWDDRNTLKTIKWSLVRKIQSDLMKIKNQCTQKNYNIEKSLKKADSKNIGIINRIKFIFILSEELEIKEKTINNFLLIIDPNKKGLINISNFIKLLEDPKLLDSYFKLENNKDEIKYK